MNQNEVNELSICLSDIPREKMTKANNGKIYVNLSVAERKTPDQWGRTLKVWISQKKTEREAGEVKVYVGSGKTAIFAEKEAVPPSASELNDLIPTAGNEESDEPPF